MSDNFLFRQACYLCIVDFIMYLLGSSFDGQNILAIAGEESSEVSSKLCYLFTNLRSIDKLSWLNIMQQSKPG